MFFRKLGPSLKTKVKEFHGFSYEKIISKKLTPGRYHIQQKIEKKWRHSEVAHFFLVRTVMIGDVMRKMFENLFVNIHLKIWNFRDVWIRPEFGSNF